MSSASEDIQQLVKRNQFSFYAAFFLLSYWWVGFDGITFSDDVFYMLAGERFWNGSMNVTDYHFSSRWGAYIPSGFIGFLFGNDPHTLSAISLLSYVGTYLALLRLVPKAKNLLVISLWFCTQVYFLHFLTKVYPDSLLVFWVCLVPIAAIYRHEQPKKAAFLLILSLFLGFITKETIVFLAPFPILLFIIDRKNKQVNTQFYFTLLLTGLGLAIIYLGYFWITFGTPFYRFSSINAGHYISKFTYADKGWTAILNRLTLLPFQAFVERAYWPWLVFAVPGVWYGLKNIHSKAHPFALSFCCLLAGFWFMSSTLEFYNPIYLNPRHLIILIPILAFLIGDSWKNWQYSRKWKLLLASLLFVGVLIALLMSDWKMAAFNLALILPVFIQKRKVQLSLLGVLLIVPAMYSIYYQQNLKQFDRLIETLDDELQDIDSMEVIYTHSFLDFSKEVLIPNQIESQNRIVPLYKFPRKKDDYPEKVKVLIYDYYQHAYPDEQEDMDAIFKWLEKNYELIEERSSRNIQVYDYVLK